MQGWGSEAAQEWQKGLTFWGNVTRRRQQMAQEHNLEARCNMKNKMVFIGRRSSTLQWSSLRQLELETEQLPICVHLNMVLSNTYKSDSLLLLFLMRSYREVVSLDREKAHLLFFLFFFFWRKCSPCQRHDQMITGFFRLEGWGLRAESSFSVILTTSRDPFFIRV